MVNCKVAVTLFNGCYVNEKCVERLVVLIGFEPELLYKRGKNYSISYLDQLKIFVGLIHLPNI